MRKWGRAPHLSCYRLLRFVMPRMVMSWAQVGLVSLRPSEHLVPPSQWDRGALPDRAPKLPGSIRTLSDVRSRGIPFGDMAPVDFVRFLGGIASRRREARALSLMLFLLSGCSSVSAPAQPSSQASSTPEPTARAALPRLLVLLQGSDTQRHLALVDLQGHEVAGADFVPDLPPLVCGAGWIQPPTIRIVGQVVYFIDRTGTIRSLDRSGATAKIGQLPVTDRQMQPYFAVSPDGHKVLATVVTWTAVNPAARGPEDCGLPGSVPQVETFSVDAGGTTRSLSRAPLTSPFKPTVVAGWDQTGPIATAETEIGHQTITPSDVFSGARLVRVDPDTGAPTATSVGGPDCKPLDVTSDWHFLCSSVADWSALSVRIEDGTVLWSQHTPRCCSVAFTPRLAPDADHVALEGLIIARGGTIASLPRLNAAGQGLLGTFVPVGWIDSQTVIGGEATQPDSLQLVSLTDLSRRTDFPLKGRFVGLLSGS